MYAMGDCSTIEPLKLLHNVKEIFAEADKDKDGKLNLEEFIGILRNTKYYALYFILKCGTWH